MKRCIWFYLQVWNLLNLVKFVSYKDLSMGWNRPVVNGMLDYLLFLWVMASNSLLLTILSSLWKEKIHSLHYWSTLMILFWVGMISLLFLILQNYWMTHLRSKTLVIWGIFLGFEVAHGTSGINICQRKYALDLLTDTDMLNSKLVSTPFDYCTRLHQSSGSLLSDSQISSYRCLIGRLIYLTNTRPNITFAIQHLSQFIASPTIAHYMTLYRILRYIKATPDLVIFFPSTS